MLVVGFLSLVTLSRFLFSRSNQPKPAMGPSKIISFNPRQNLIPKGVRNWSPDEPAFSLSLKGLWASRQDLGSPVSRLIISSESRYLKDFKYQAIVGVNVLKPKGSTLTEAVEQERSAIRQTEGFQGFLVEKRVKLAQLDGYSLEFLSRDGREWSEELNHLAGGQGSQIRHHDVFLLKNGYLVDVYGVAYGWAWAEFGQEIEATINSFKFLED